MREAAATTIPLPGNTQPAHASDGDAFTLHNGHCHAHALLLTQPHPLYPSAQSPQSAFLPNYLAGTNKLPPVGPGIKSKVAATLP